MVGSITWPSFFEPIKIGVLGDFLCTVFRGWCKISVFEKKNWSKKGFPKKKMCTFFLGSFGFTSLLLHDGTRCFRRVCKKPYKNSFFWHALLLDAEETEKRRKNKKKAQKKVTPIFGWPSKRAGSSSTIFLQKIGFSKSSKNPIFIAFPEKWVATIFFQKGYVTKRTDLEAKKK